MSGHQIKPKCEWLSLSVKHRGTGQDTREGKSMRGTHQLSYADGETNQDSKRKLESEKHSQTVKCRGRDKLGQQEKAGVQVALTPCQTQRKEQIRTSRESKRAKGTHLLLGTEGDKSGH
jgi:hypothetical protein